MMLGLALAGGNVVERYTYDPYGRPEVYTADIGTHPGFVDEHYQFDFFGSGPAEITDLDCTTLYWCASLSDYGAYWPCLFYGDFDRDGRVDAGDLQEFVRIGPPCDCTTSGCSFELDPLPEWRRTEVMLGDSDADGDLDLRDYGMEGSCPGSALADCTLVFNLNGDVLYSWTDDEQRDRKRLSRILTGPSQPVPEPRDGTRYGNPFLFTGQRYDPETGLYFFWARPFDPELGRFLQRDKMGEMAAAGDVSLSFGGIAPTLGPVAFRPGDIYENGLCLYLYAGSNPGTFNDPWGLWFDEDPESTLLVIRDWDAIYNSIVGNDRAYLGVQGAGTWGSAWGGNVTALPKFATGMAGVSQGMSDYADFYAAQVMYLPVDAALGMVGVYAAVGTQADDVVRLATRRGHHPIAKFLGGHELQWLRKLPWGVHRKFHKLLRQKLALRFGGKLPLPIGGTKGGTKAWTALFRREPEAQRKAFDAILDASRVFDEKHGTNLVELFWRNVMEGRFTSFM